MRPPGFHETHGALEHDLLLLPCVDRGCRAGTRHLASGLRRQVPTPVQGASTRTRSASPSRPARGRPLVVAACEFLDIARAGALDPRVDRREATLIVVGRDDARLDSPRKRPAPASFRPRPRRDRSRSRRLHSGKQRDELGGLVLDSDEAGEKSGLQLHRGSATVIAMRRGEARAARTASARGEGERAPPGPLRASPSAC